MGPKPKKNSPTRSKSPTKAINDAAFFTTNLNDEDFKVMIAFVLPTNEFDELYIEQLEKSVKKGHRRRFTWFSKKDLIDLIAENTSSAKKAPVKKPAGAALIPSAFLTVIDQAKQLLDNKEEIPDQLMTQLIKAKLILIRNAEKEKEIARQNRLKDKKDHLKTAGTKKDKSPSGKKSPSKSKKTNATGPVSDIEKQSQLKRKEDIEEEEKYFDDEPKDGPQHYIILSGFYSASLLNFLDEYQLPIDCIIKFKSPNSDRILKFMSEIQEREKTESNLKANLRINVEAVEKTTVNIDVLNEERQQLLNKTKAKLEKYWIEVNQLLERVDDKLKLRQHIARLKYNLKRDPDIKSWFEVEKRAEFADMMFDEVAEKLYTLTIQKRQYGFYIGNLKVYSIPPAVTTFAFPPGLQSGSALSQSLAASARGEDLNASIVTGTTAQNTITNESEKFCDMRYYNELLNSFPAEYISTPIILHCMLEQIVATEEKKPLPSESNHDDTIPLLPNLSYDISKYFSEMVSNLAIDDREMNNLNHLLPRQRPDNLKKKMSSNTPYLVNFNDENGNRLKGVFEDSSQKRNKKSNFKIPFDPSEVEAEMLSKSMWTIFTGLPYVPAKLAKERAARLQELLHFCSTPEITNTDVDRAFKQFVFETMNLTDTNRRNTIRHSDKNIVIPWDDPYPNINSILNEDQQALLKNLNQMDAKKEHKEQSEEAKKARNRISSASTTKSIKFSDANGNSSENNKDSSLSSILKSRSSTKLSVQSVHFPDTFEINSNEQFNELVQPKTIDQSIEMINSTKKRDLTEWNLAEHYEPKVLVQKLQKVSYTHPYVDSYYNRRDNSLMLVFSNPYDESVLANNEDWTIKLHSNVGFRNYLEKIYEMIVDWTRDEEAKYQASLIAKEVEKIRSESLEREKELLANASSSRPTSKSTKEPPASPKDKKKQKVEPISADEGDYITENFVSHNSLKAWKIEQEKNRGDSISTAKDRKKAKSPKPKSPDPKKESKASKSPVKAGETPKPKASTSRVPSPKKGGSRSNSKVSIEPVSAPAVTESIVQKANVPFIGYDVGNNMIYVKSHLNHMFPSNGALIKTEKHVLKTSGKIMITTSVIKDGHTFSLHIVDPKSEEEISKMASHKLQILNSSRKSPTHLDQQSLDGITLIDNQSSIRSEDEDHIDRSIAKYSCFTGVFTDGLSVSYSVHYLKRKVKKSSVPDIPPTPRTLISENQQAEKAQERPQTSDDKSKKSTAKLRSDKKSDTQSNPATNPKNSSTSDTKKPEENTTTTVTNKLPDIKEEPPTFRVLPWSQLFLSLPTGLTCTFLPETYTGVEPTQHNEPHRLIVKQYYSSRCDERACENFKNLNPHILKEKSRLIKSDGSVIKFLNNNNIEIYYPNGTIYRKSEEVITVNKSDIAEVEPSEVSDNSKKDRASKKTTIKADEPQAAHPLPNVHFEQKLRSKWTFITPNGSQFLINKEDKTNELMGYHRCIQARDIQTGEVMITREDNLKIVYRTDGSSLVEFEDGTRITTFYAQNDLNTSTDHDTTEYSEQKKEKYIKIECQGFASTIFNSKTTECTLAFGTGTLVACDPKKMIYNVIYNTGELLDVNQEGVVSYLPRNSMENSKNKFMFSQVSEHILEHEDEEGNKFNVSKLGKCSTSLTNPNSNRNKIKFYQKHSPRFFVIHKDSSGTELLRYEDINQYMDEVEVDPMTAIIRDNVQGFPNIMGTTVLRPLKNCLTDVWLCEYDEKDVTPPGLRCRNLGTFPPNPEIKVPGHKFGTNIGRGLQIDLDQQRKVKNPPLTIAKRMEYRQLIEYQKVSDEVRASLLNGLKNYMKYIAERAENHRLLLTHDPRSEAEKLTAFKVLKLARPDNLFKADISAMYRNALAHYSIENYGKTIKTINKLLVKNRSNRLENLKEELNKEKLNREAWKTMFVPSYFKSDWGKAFLENDSSLRDSTNFLQTSENVFNPNEQSQAIKDNYDENYESKSIKKTSLPPITNYQMKESFANDKSRELISQQFGFERYQPKFKYADKLAPNKLPNSLKTNRINAIPNTTFLSVEDPVRRKVNTSIIQASLLNGKPLERRRGCEVFPSEIKFGILREGINYAVDFKLINVGVDACRFKIKQPAQESGLKLVYKSGPIAAGMSRDISVVLLALYKIESESVVEQVDPKMRSFKHMLEITTETDTILVPIEAEILAADEFRNMFRGNLEAGKNPTTRIISVRPGSVRELLTRQITVQNMNSKKQTNANYLLNEPFV